jgi:hypothetical protein
MSNQWTRLNELLAAAVVKVEARRTLGQDGNGTGCFVAPGLVLTCRHVVDGDADLEVKWNGEGFPATVTDRAPDFEDGPDLALLRVSIDTHPWHPCVLLDAEQPAVGDVLSSFGFPAKALNARLSDLGDPMTFTCEGIEGGAPGLIKLKGGQALSGQSGAPLLSARTGKVCGVVHKSRDEESDLGARAIPPQDIFSRYPELSQRQRDYHDTHRGWTDSLTSVQRGDLRRAPVVVPETDRKLIYGIALSADGSMLASSGFAREERESMYLWSLDAHPEGARKISSFHLEEQGTHLAFSPDRATFACVDETGGGVVLKTTGDRVATLTWNVQPHGIWGAINQHLGAALLSLAYSPDGSLLAIGRADNIVGVYSLHSCDWFALLVDRDGVSPPRISLPGMSGATAVGFDRDGQRVAVGYGDKSVSVWEVASRRELHRLQVGAPVSAVCWSPDARSLVAGGSDGRWLTWDVVSGEVLAGEAVRGRIWCAAFSEDGVHMALGSPDGALLRNGRTGATTRPRSPQSVHAVAFDPFGSCVLAGGRFELASISKARVVQRIPMPLIRGPLEVARIPLPGVA